MSQSHIACQLLEKHIFQSLCLHVVHTAMLVVICWALRGGKNSKSHTETWLVFRCLGGLGGWYNEKFNTSQALILTHSFILSHLFSVPLIYSFFFPLFHASPWPYTIFQRGFDLVMGEQPSDRIFR